MTGNSHAREGIRPGLSEPGHIMCLNECITNSAGSRATSICLRAGGDITVDAGKEGVLMVDTEFAPLANKIMTEVRRLTNAPLLFIVNIHVHAAPEGQAESAGGRAEFQPLKIIAHSNVLNRIDQSQTVTPLNARDVDHYAAQCYHALRWFGSHRAERRHNKPKLRQTAVERLDRGVACRDPGFRCELRRANLPLQFRVAAAAGDLIMLPWLSRPESVSRQGLCR